MEYCVTHCPFLDFFHFKNLLPSDQGGSGLHVQKHMQSKYTT